MDINSNSVSDGDSGAGSISNVSSNSVSSSVLNLANDIAKNVGYRGNSVNAAKLVLNVLETKYAQTSDPELRRCVEIVIGELHKASAAVPAAAVAADAPNEDCPDPIESPTSPVEEQIPIAEIHAVCLVTSAEYQTRLPEYKVKANSLRRKAAKSWLSVEAINASEGVLGVLLNKHGQRVIMDQGGKETEPPPPIPLFSTRDHLEDPRLVAYVPHDRPRGDAAGDYVCYFESPIGRNPAPSPPPPPGEGCDVFKIGDFSVNTGESYMVLGPTREDGRFSF